MRKRTGQARSKRGPSFDPDIPVAGCYRTRFVKDGPSVGLRIYFGRPLDPETGEEMDRAPRWLAAINGVQVVDAFRFWPGCARDPINSAEYIRICRRSATTDPANPYFDPFRPIDPAKAPPPF